MITHSIPKLPEADPTLFEGMDGTADRLDSPSAVDHRSHLADLRQSLNYLNAMDASDIRDENDPSDTVAKRRAARQTEHDLAFGHFARAYLGAAALRAKDVYEPNSPEYKESWTQFQYFKRQYESPRNAQRRAAYWQELSSAIASLDKTNTTAAEASIAPERRSPGSPQYPTELGTGAEREDILTTREKLQALHADTRARFLPTTHREKTAALSLLNYMDTRNALYSTPRDKIDAQLSEIYDHQIKVSNNKYEAEKKAALGAGDRPSKGPIEHAREAQNIAVDSVRSVINEWDDYRENAGYSVNELILLFELASEQGSPKTTLAELLNDDKRVIDVQPLLRYLDLKSFRDTGELPSFDPLVTREIRPVPEEYDAKNKIVIDTYLNVPDVRKRADEFAEMTEAITVKTLRKVLPDAIKDSMHRREFFSRALRGITGPYRVFAGQTTRTKSA